MTLVVHFITAVYSIVTNATNFKWTRDPFDRIIVSNASLDGEILVTKDQTMLNHYKHAKW
ncbi:MAG: hypothetical protein ACUZ8O_01410 [Candidatus Anammoxibacter sp.]